MGQQPDEVVDRKILEAIRGPRRGSVEVIVHDSKVVQIERREKVRLDAEVRARRTPPAD